MKLLIIPDSFKGSVSSEQIIENLSRGIRTLDPGIEITGITASDGGEGFLEMVGKCIDTRSVYHDTLDPIGRPIEAEYLFEDESETAYIEFAQASGYERLLEEERNPMNTSSTGTGLQILHAINRGAKTIYIGLGGSATNDGGIGMASVLGYRFLDSFKKPVLPLGKNLDQIQFIEGRCTYPGVQFFAVNDVINPLFGANGAAFTYAAQKGAVPDEVVQLDQGLFHLNEMVKRYLEIDYSLVPGAGAAGGAAYGLKSFLDARFINGNDFLFQTAGIDQLLSSGDYDAIITGEGRLDQQSFQGKLISGVIEYGVKYDIPVIAICGSLSINDNFCKEKGLTAIIEIADQNVSLADRMEHAEAYIESMAGRLLEVIGAIE